MKKLLFFILSGLTLISCTQKVQVKKLKKLKENEAFVNAMTQDKNSYFYIDIQNYPKDRKEKLYPLEFSIRELAD